MKLKISINTDPINLSILWKLYKGPGMVLGYLNFEIWFQSLGGFRLFWKR